MLSAVHLPFHLDLRSIGWYVIHPTESISVDVIERKDKQLVSMGAPITRFDAVEKAGEPVGDSLDLKSAETANERLAPEAAPTVERLAGRRVFEAAGDTPKVIGGMGAYYIHIEFPEEALLEGIQGQLVLSFIVETDGRTTDIEVIQPLHPACDSAAVHALRKTRFIPGRQDGEVVPVRMRLPVRFKILAREDGLAATNEASG